MLRGKNLLHITAEGAGRINAEQRNKNQMQKETEEHASINFTYPLHNVTGHSNF